MITIIFGLILLIPLATIFALCLDNEEFLPFKISIVVFIFLMFCFTILDINGFHYNTGSGEHSGFVTAVEKTGIIWKTNTVYFKTDNQSSQEDKYCLIDENMVTILKEKSEKKEHITIQYKSFLIPGAKVCNGESDYIVGIK